MVSNVAVLEAELWELRMTRAPYKTRLAALAKLTAARQQDGPPAPSYRTCCPLAQVEHSCSCSYVTRCAEHGQRHHGTHD